MNATQESQTSNPGQAAPGYAPQYAQAPPVAAVPMRDPRSKSPALAAILSMMPGLGQVYVGYYQRGFIHAIVVASLITLLASGGGGVGVLIPLIALFMAFFWLYNIIDAARRASLYNQVLAGNPSIEMPHDFEMPSMRGSIAGGVAMLVIGFILLLNTRFGVSLEWVEYWWPVAPMIFGGFLLYRAIRDRQSSSPDDRDRNPQRD